MEKILKAILNIGEQIQLALSTDDLDSFYDLLEEREKLVASLNQMAATTPLSPIHSDAARALEAQFNSIIELLDKKEEQMMEQLRHVDRFRKAGQSYTPPVERRQFINKDLRG